MGGCIWLARLLTSHAPTTDYARPKYAFTADVLR